MRFKFVRALDLNQDRGLTSFYDVGDKFYIKNYVPDENSTQEFKYVYVTKKTVSHGGILSYDVADVVGGFEYSSGVYYSAIYELSGSDIVAALKFI